MILLQRLTLACIVILTLCISGTAQNPTWADDVACIVYNNCTKCHHPGGVAPVPFMTYEDVFAKRSTVRLYVADRSMPPSPAVPGDIAFRDDNLLTEEEIQTIVTWVQQGAPSGNLGSAPPQPTIPNAEAIANPDAVIRIDPYTSNAVDDDDYRCFAFGTEFGEDKWVTGVELVPGNKGIVHHVLLYEDANESVLTLDQLDPLSGYECFGGVGSFSANFVGGWVPGQSAQFIPEGMGILIPNGTNLIMQTHYPHETAGQVDSTKANLRFAPNGDGLRRIQVVPYINHFTSLTNGPLFIPANETRTFHADAVVLGNVSLTSVLPHMHLLGTSMTCYAVLPITLDTVRLFDIPDWDFDWQLSYSFKSPIHLPFGTHIIAEATYDNTVNNPRNPNFPPQDVSAGESTTDEMFLIFFSYLIYQNGDENIVFEEAPAFSEACETVATSEPARSSMYISPNPVDKRFVIQTSWTNYTITLHDAFGRTLLRGKNLTEVNTSTLTDGMYVVVAENGKERHVEKIMVAH